MGDLHFPNIVETNAENNSNVYLWIVAMHCGHGQHGPKQVRKTKKTLTVLLHQFGLEILLYIRLWAIIKLLTQQTTYINSFFFLFIYAVFTQGRVPIIEKASPSTH